MLPMRKANRLSPLIMNTMDNTASIAVVGVTSPKPAVVICSVTACGGPHGVVFALCGEKLRAVIDWQVQGQTLGLEGKQRSYGQQVHTGGQCFQGHMGGHTLAGQTGFKPGLPTSYSWGSDAAERMAPGGPLRRASGTTIAPDQRHCQDQAAPLTTPPPALLSSPDGSADILIT